MSFVQFGKALSSNGRSKRDRQGKGDSMTQEEELKKGEVGYKKSSDSSEKKRARERNLCNLNQW